MMQPSSKPQKLALQSLTQGERDVHGHPIRVPARKPRLRPTMTPRARARLLIELANALPQSYPRFQNRNRGKWVPQPNAYEFQELADLLRQFWNGNEVARTVLLPTLVRRANDPNWGKALVSDGANVRVNPQNLMLQVALGIEECARRMALCDNESCQAPYFLRSKKHQLCCSVCADAARKRRWWKKHGAEWRARRRPKRKAKQTKAGFLAKLRAARTSAA